MRSHPHRPQQLQRAYGPTEKRVIARAQSRLDGVRGNLEKHKIGLIVPRAIQAEIEREALLAQIPSRATIERVMQAHGITGANSTATSAAYYPHPRPTATYMMNALDWISRRVQSGAYAFAFPIQPAAQSSLSLGGWAVTSNRSSFRSTNPNAMNWSNARTACGWQPSGTGGVFAA